ncbi:MAG: hypothetical protein KBD90_01130 [Alphaproteobacteria bacterium]|nr:hypothetical protein [Alphaproteobacteria bacterium]
MSKKFFQILALSAVIASIGSVGQVQGGQGMSSDISGSTTSNNPQNKGNISVACTTYMGKTNCENKGCVWTKDLRTEKVTGAIPLCIEKPRYENLKSNGLLK